MSQNPLYNPPYGGRHVHEGRGSSSGATPGWTVSQLVSYNLNRARRSRGWTQQEFGEQIGQYTGRAWSNASVSAAERAWQGGRPRKFDVDEITAFCAIFDVSFAYFLLPPEGDFMIMSIAEPGEGQEKWAIGTAPIEYLKRILGVDPSADFLDRAQAAVSEHASLDFTPAKWDRDWSEEPRPTPEAAPPKRDRPEKVPAEQSVEKAEEARKKLEQLVKDLGLSEGDVDLVTKARTDELAHGVALQLEKWGYLRVPEIEEEIRDLREKVRRLSGRREMG